MRDLLTPTAADRTSPVGGPSRPEQRPIPAAPAPRVLRLATRGSVAAALVAVTVGLLLPGGWGPTGPAVLVGGLLLGLPHGAVDHLVPSWAGSRLRRRQMITLLAGYVGTAALAFLALRAAPLAGLVVFVVVSALHFGSGELHVAELRRGTKLSCGTPDSADPVGVLAYAGAALVLPLVCWPQQVLQVTQLLVPGSTSLPSPVRYAAMAVVLAAVAAAVAQRLRHRWLAEAGELVLLAVLAVTVPPTVSFGVYFGAWHSVRHVARMVVLDPQNATDVAGGRVGVPLGRFARKAALPTSAAALTLLVLWQAAPGWQAFVVADLSLLAGLTVPHMLIVAWLDHRSQAPVNPEAGRHPEVAPASNRLS